MNRNAPLYCLHEEATPFGAFSNIKSNIHRLRLRVSDCCAPVGGAGLVLLQVKPSPLNGGQAVWVEESSRPTRASAIEVIAIHVPCGIPLNPPPQRRVVHPVPDVVEARLGVEVVAAVENHVVVGGRVRRARPGPVVERRVAVRVVHHALQHRAARIHQGRHVHVRVRGVVQRIVNCTVGVGVMEADDGRIDVPQVPDVLLERVGRVAALVDLQHLPRGVVVDVGGDGGAALDGLGDAPAEAVVFVRDDERVLAGVEITGFVGILVDLDEAVPGVDPE